MGQTPSKRISKTSTSTSTTYLNPPSPSSPSSITPPAPPRRLTHLSELIDLDELFPNGQVIDSRSPTPLAHLPNASRRTIVQSPSGQELDAYAYLSRPDRPLTVQERQQRILERLQQESRLETERRKETLRMMTAREEIARRKRGQRGCRGLCLW